MRRRSRRVDPAPADGLGVSAQLAADLLGRRPAHVSHQPHLLPDADQQARTGRTAPATARGTPTSGRRGGCGATTRPATAAPAPSCWSTGRWSVNGRRPKKWQIELTLQVTWWLKNRRTSPPQMRPVTAPSQVRVISPPSANGSANETTTQSQKRAVDEHHHPVGRADPWRSAARSVRLCSNSQPTCACPRPLSWPQIESSKPWWGLCGSPSLSENAWWVRWSTAQSTAEPWIAIEPEHQQRRLQRRHRLEGAVGEHPVVADRDPEPAQHVQPERTGPGRSSRRRGSRACAIAAIRPMNGSTVITIIAVLRLRLEGESRAAGRLVRGGPSSAIRHAP